MSFEYLDPFETNRYNTQASNARTQYLRGLAKNTYNQSQVQADFNLNRQADNMKFDQIRTQLPGQFVNRGVMNSGIYQSAMKNYAQNRMLSGQQLNANYQRSMGDIQQSGLDLTTNLNTTLNSVEAEKQARRAQLATQLKGM